MATGFLPNVRRIIGAVCFLVPSLSVIVYWPLATNIPIIWLLIYREVSPASFLHSTGALAAMITAIYAANMALVQVKEPGTGTGVPESSLTILSLHRVTPWIFSGI